VTEKEKIGQLADRLSGFSCTIAVEAHDEDLYGSISADDIVNAIREEQITVDRQSIILEKPIKKLGIYEVGVQLDPEISTKIKVWVVKK